MKRGFNKTQKNYIIGSLIAIVLIMTVAFAAFSTSLNIQGTSKVDSKWDVEIVSITPNSTANKVENTYTNSGDITHSITNNLTANFSAVLISPGDSVVYTIAVENKGTLDAQLDSITKNLGNNSDITFSISGINESSLPEKLVAGAKKEFAVTVTFVNNPAGQGNPTNKTSSFSLTMNYSQYGSSSGGGSSETEEENTIYIPVPTTMETFDEHIVSVGDSLADISNYDTNYNSYGQEFIKATVSDSNTINSLSVCLYDGTKLMCINSDPTKFEQETTKFFGTGVCTNEWGYNCSIEGYGAWMNNIGTEQEPNYTVGAYVYDVSSIGLYDNGSYIGWAS